MPDVSGGAPRVYDLPFMQRLAASYNLGGTAQAMRDLDLTSTQVSYLVSRARRIFCLDIPLRTTEPTPVEERNRRKAARRKAQRHAARALLLPAEPRRREAMGWDAVVELRSIAVKRNRMDTRGLMAMLSGSHKRRQQSAAQ